MYRANVINGRYTVHSGVVRDSSVCPNWVCMMVTETTLYIKSNNF